MKSSKSRIVEIKTLMWPPVKHNCVIWKSILGLEEFWVPTKYLKAHEKVFEFERKRAEKEEMETKRKASEAEEEDAKKDTKRAKVAQV